MPTLSANVQYDDWKGTAAADDADMGGIRTYLRDKGILTDDEFLVGFEIYSGQQIGPSQRYFSARVFIVEAGDYEGAVQAALRSDPIQAIVKELQISLDEFFSFFKRFDVLLTHASLEIHGREYREIER